MTTDSTPNGDSPPEAPDIADALDSRVLLMQTREALLDALDRDDPRAAIAEILATIDESCAHEHDLRSAHVSELYAVWDEDQRRGEMNVRAVFASERDANRYRDAQHTEEFCKVEAVPAVWRLPEPRPLYLMHGLVLYPSGNLRVSRDEIAADGEFPGLDNGAIVGLDEVNSSLTEAADGWRVFAAGWDREDVEAEFAGRLDAGQRARAALVQAFAGFREGVIVSVESGPHEGKVLARVNRYGVPCWHEATGKEPLPIHDHTLDPDALRVVPTGGDA